MNFFDDTDDGAGQLAALHEEHRDLDSAITALVETSIADQLKIARLKKRKLALKDQIAKLHTQTIPDIIA
ncbi:MAG: DUF465 domain-containing protein [Robiginitomaculum sp.]|nr:DUF465 domain-containing protein [Robiginitomaculum sp.]